MGGISLFDNDSPEKNEPTDYTGLKIVAILAPVFLIFVIAGNADMGLAACTVFGMIMLAIKMRWRSRRHPWFWATIAIILTLHVPFVLRVRWPHGNVPMIGYTLH